MGSKASSSSQCCCNSFLSLRTLWPVVMWELYACLTSSSRGGAICYLRLRFLLGFVVWHLSDKGVPHRAMVLGSLNYLCPLVDKLYRLAFMKLSEYVFDGEQNLVLTRTLTGIVWNETRTLHSFKWEGFSSSELYKTWQVIWNHVGCGDVDETKTGCRNWLMPKARKSQRWTLSSTVACVTLWHATFPAQFTPPTIVVVGHLSLSLNNRWEGESS